MISKDFIVIWNSYLVWLNKINYFSLKLVFNGYFCDRYLSVQLGYSYLSLTWKYIIFIAVYDS